MFTITKHIVKSVEEKTRLYDYAFDVFQKYIPSKKGIKKALKRGEIWVNNKPGKSGDWVKENQYIELKDLELTPPEPYSLNLEVIFEDEYLAVINKPAGISVSGNQYRTIQNCIVNQIKLSTKPDALKWPRPVHRLDNQTSGLLLIAKTASSIINLSKQFEERRIQKKYIAIVMGKPSQSGEINLPIESQVANTTFRTLKTIDSLQSKNLSLTELHPNTGRTHQLRIHCAESGFPILGDKIYGEKGNMLLHKGLFLAAIKLKLTHPKSGKIISFKIEKPSKFDSLLKREERRWNKFNLQK